jgi:uncharacterized protein (DUF2147 family)
MKYFILPFLFISFSLNAQTIFGKWKTIDDKSGKEKSIVEIYEKGGKITGKVIKIFPQPGTDPDPVCQECPEEDDRYLKKVIGMEIIRNMVATKTIDMGEGEILDPEVGKVYRCKVWVEGTQLMVRGYWGPFFRTQVWNRLN